MLIIGLIFSVVCLSTVPIHSSVARSVHFIRSTTMVFLLCVMLNIPFNVDIVELYHSVFSYSSITFIIDSLLYVVGALFLVGFSTQFNDNLKPEYSLILIFGILGASMIISANDLISIYIALELQSFSLYLLACIRIDLTGSTHASLKYFLLGAMSSAFILLGISLVYQQIGTTNFSAISAYIETVKASFEGGVNISLITEQTTLILGLMSILCGFMFKISAAPFHSWFSDVIQGVPTYTSMIIINLPKISIFAFLFNFLHLTVKITDISSVQIFVILTTMFSLILGTVAGLMQTKMKRLLAFSTISHVGFLLIAIVVGSEAEYSLNALMFYITQYTLVTILSFLSLMAYENYFAMFGQERTSAVHGNNPNNNSGVNNIADLQGIGYIYKVLTFTFILCLFSMAGIPPLTGFYAKLEILNSTILTNHPIVFITAIICSVISAAYYLKVIKVVMFDEPVQTEKMTSHAKQNMSVSSVHSYSIAVLTAFITLFILDPKLIINCTELVALSIYITLPYDSFCNSNFCAYSCTHSTSC